MTANLGVVQETMLILLVIKANETLRQKARIRDEKAVEIMKQLQMDTEKYDKFMSHEGVVARTIMFDQALKQFLEKYPEALCPGLTLLRENSFNDVMKTYTYAYTWPLAPVRFLRRSPGTASTPLPLSMPLFHLHSV